MKKMIYLHGFASSSASGTVDVLRRAFWEVPAHQRMTVVAPDITAASRDVFAQHYPGQLSLFEGGHRLNADLVHAVLIPAIRTAMR